MKLSPFSWSLSMDPDQIQLESMSKQFEYERQARIIDECKNIGELQNVCKSFAKLYYKQQEVMKSIGLPS
jgi:hypothetical protein